MVTKYDLIADNIAHKIIMLDKFLINKHNSLVNYLNYNYNIDLLKFENDVSDTINNIYLFINNIPGVSTIKSIESYLNYSANEKVYVVANLNNNQNFFEQTYINIVIIYMFIIFILLFIDLLRPVYRDYRTIVIYAKLNIEIENNISNFLDLKRAVILFIFFFTILISGSLNYNGYTSYVNSFFIIFFLNFCTLCGYLYMYNINIYVFIKGLFTTSKLNFNFMLDNITLSIFVSRLFLQLIRFIICTIVVCIFHENAKLCFSLLVDFLLYQIKSNHSSLIIDTTKILLEFLDLIINFTAQYSIYIVSVLWLIPFLFTFIKKFLKISNK